MAQGTLVNGERRAKNLYLVRHGETDYNLNKMVQGRGVDEPLNENGKKQALALAERFKNVPLDVIVSSTLKRATQTANLIRKYHPNTPYYAFSDLEEMGYGIFEGKHYDINHKDTIFHELRTYVKAWDDGEDTQIPGGERPSDVSKRAMKILYQLMQTDDYSKGVIGHQHQSTPPQQFGTQHTSPSMQERIPNILVVCHGRMLKIVMCKILDQPLKYMAQLHQDNTCVNLLKWRSDKKFEIVYLNDTSHVKQKELHTSFLNIHEKSNL